MTNRERFFALVHDHEPVVLTWYMAFFNDRVARRLLGAENVPQDTLPSTEWRYGASNRADWDAKIRYAKATGNCATSVGFGACIPFGHGQPGEFAERLIEVDEEHRLSEYETGVKKEVRYNPYFYHHMDYPIHSQADLEAFELPNATDPTRYVGLEEEIAYYKQNDLVTCANLNGFFSGIHYFLYPYEDLLASLLLDPDFVEEMVERVGQFNLQAAENLAKLGVDMINFCDDLGSGSSLLMRPTLYRKYFLPWHRRLADVCHGHGVLLHMHSHGNINQIVGDLYAAGIDMLNPLDPEESMDLADLKRRYGDRMTFVGGLHKAFYDWPYEEQEAFVEQLLTTTGGGFILMDSGGVPENVTKERFSQVQALFQRMRNHNL